MSALDVWRSCSDEAITDALRALRGGAVIRLAKIPAAVYSTSGSVSDITMETAEFEARQTKPTLIVVGRMEPDGPWEYIAHYDNTH